MANDDVIDMPPDEAAIESVSARPYGREQRAVLQRQSPAETVTRRFPPDMLPAEDIAPPETLPSDQDTLPSDADPSLMGEEASLRERYRLHTVDGFYRGTLAGTLRLNSMAHFAANPDDPDTPPAVKQARDKLRSEYRDIVADLGRFDLMAPFGSTAEAAVALGGQIVGGFPSPESFVGLPAKGATAIVRAGKAAVQQGAIQLATDPVIQAGSIKSGVQHEYEAMRTVAAPFVGAIFGGGIHLGGELITSTALKRLRGDLASDDPSMRAAGDEPAAPKPTEPPHAAEPDLSPEMQDMIAREGSGQVLPGESIVADQDFGGVPIYKVMIGDQEIGTARLRRDGPTEAHISRVELDPEFQRQGIGTRLYDRIEADLAAQNIQLRPDAALTDAAIAFWRGRRPEAVAGYVKPEGAGMWRAPVRDDFASLANQPSVRPEGNMLGRLIADQVGATATRQKAPVFYRGLNEPFDGTFSLDRAGHERAIFFTNDREYINRRELPHVVGATFDAKNPKTIDWQQRKTRLPDKQNYNRADMLREVDQARAEGHDVLYVENIHEGASFPAHTQVAVLDPSIIRQSPERAGLLDGDLAAIASEAVKALGRATRRDGVKSEVYQRALTEAKTAFDKLMAAEAKLKAAAAEVRTAAREQSSEALQAFDRAMGEVRKLSGSEEFKTVDTMVETLRRLRDASPDAERPRGAPSIPDSADEGMRFAMAARQGGGNLPMERSRPQAGVSSQQQTGTAVAAVAQAASPQEEVALRSLQQQAMDFADAIGFPLREGRMGGKARSVLGFLKTRNGVVRVREIADLEVVAHEGGHYIELRAGKDLTDMTNAFASELAPLVSNPSAYKPGVHVKEGFAEYIRRFVGNPAHAAQIAPGFSVAFRNFMENRHPEIMRTLDQAAAGYKAYLDAPSVDAVGAVRRSVDETPKGFRAVIAAVKENGFAGSIKNVMQWAYTSYSDKDAPLARAVREINMIAKEKAGKLLDLKAADNPEVLQRLFARTEQAAVRDMMDGVRPYRDVTPQGPSLSQALSRAIGEPTTFGRWDDGKRATFSTYLIARRSEYLWRKFEQGLLPNPPAAFSKADAMVAMGELERANPKFREASDMVHSYTRELLRKGHEGHQITTDLYNKLLQEEFYVPFMRDLTDKPLAGGDPVQRGAADRTPDIVQRMRGSTRDIKDPIESLMLQTFLVNRAIRSNDRWLALRAHSERAGIEGGKYFEDIPAHEMRKYTFDLGDAIERKAIEKGMDPTFDAPLLRSMMTDLFGEDPLLGTFFRAEPAGKRGEPIVFYKEGGEMKAARIMSEAEGHALYETMTAMPQALNDLSLQVLATGSTILRSGIVLNPVYALSNYIRDQVAVGILRSDYVPFIGGAKGIAAELKQTQPAKLYGYGGGVSAGAAVAPLQQAAEARVQALAKDGWTVQRFQSLHSFLEGTQIAEAGTRNSVFAKVYDTKRQQGLSEYEAMIEAAYSAQDILDFSRWGSKTLAMRALTPFVNSHIQGLDKAYRTMIEPLLRTAATSGDAEARKNAVLSLTKFMAVGSALGAGWAALHSADSIYQDADPRIMGTHFVTSVGGKMIVIPKPFELSLGFTAGEFAFRRLMQDDPRAAEQFTKAAFDVLTPPVPIFANPLIKTSAELALGKSFFTGRDIVPETKQRLATNLQYTDRTSEAAKLIGATIGVAPIKVDHAIGGYFGLWGRDIMALSSGINEDAPTQSIEDYVFFRRFIKDPTRTSDATSRFWDHMGRTTGKYNQAVASYDALIGRRSPEGDVSAREFLAKLPAAERAFVILRSSAAENGKPAFNAEVKRLHPLQRAYDAVTVLNGVRQELSDNRFFSFESGERMLLSPQARGELRDAVRELAQKEMRNALTITKEPGYAGRALLDLDESMAKIRAASPAAAEEIMTRYATARIYKTGLVARTYPLLQDALTRQGSDADLGQFVEAEYEFGGERVKRPQKRRVPIPAR